MGYSTANLCHSRGVTKSHHWPLKALGPLLAHGKHFEWSAMLASNYMHPKTNKLAWHSFSTNIKCLRMVMGNWMMYICLLGTGLWVTYQNVAFLLFIGFVHKIKSEWKKLEKSRTRGFFLFPNVDAADTAHPAWLIKCNLWLRLMEGAARCSRPKTINEKGLLGHSLKVQRVQLIIIQLPPTRFCLCWSPLHYNRSIFLGLFLGIDKTFSQFLK